MALKRHADKMSFPASVILEVKENPALQLNLVFPAINLFRISGSVGYHHPARTVTDVFMSRIYTSGHCSLRSDALCPRYLAGKDKELSALV